VNFGAEAYENDFGKAVLSDWAGAATVDHFTGKVSPGKGRRRVVTGANHPASHHRRSDGGPERRHQHSDGGPERLA